MMHVLGRVVWLITAFAAINIGTTALFDFDVLARMPEGALYTVSVIIGVAGALSLWMCLSNCMGRCNCMSKCD